MIDLVKMRSDLKVLACAGVGVTGARRPAR